MLRINSPPYPQGAVDLDAITDPAERKATEGMINNFGQTPAQLLTQPHPQRMSTEKAAKARATMSAGTRRQLVSLFDSIDRLKAYFVPVSICRKIPLIISPGLIQLRKWF